MPIEGRADLQLVGDPGVDRWCRQVQDAWRAARTGRHAQAIRMCRAAASALARRGAWREELAARLLLVRLHLQRGEPALALLACEEAEACAGLARDPDAAATCRVWRAWALVEAGDCAQARVMAEAACAVWREGWRGRNACTVLTTALAGTRTASGRRDLPDPPSWAVPVGAPATDEWPLALRAWAARIEALVRAGCLFQAGREAAAFGAAAASCRDEEAVAEAALANLRVVAAAGQAVAVEESVTRTLRMARDAHLPYVRLRALGVWRAYALAGGDVRAGALWARVRRLAARAPLGWQRLVAWEPPPAGPGLAAQTLAVQTTEKPTLDPAIQRSMRGPAVPGLIGETLAIVRLREEVARAARTTFPVLIEGETGSGKELVARGLHALGPRSPAAFLDVNCAALADDLVDAELFGHTKGAFTGAVGCRAGLIEQASGGTLFLDEVADLAPRVQAKLLRALQQQEVRRVGEGRARPVDVRIVAACNRSLDEEVAAGRFRADLVFRVAGIRILVPPLRARAGDIPLLVEAFWPALAAQAGTTATLMPAVIEQLTRYHWPGNVRELQHVLATLAIRAPATGRVTLALVPSSVGTCPEAPAEPLAAARGRFERDYARAALAQAGHSQARAARALGLSRQGLRKLLLRTADAEPA